MHLLLTSQMHLAYTVMQHAQRMKLVLTLIVFNLFTLTLFSQELIKEIYRLNKVKSVENSFGERFFYKDGVLYLTVSFDTYVTDSAFYYYDNEGKIINITGKSTFTEEDSTYTEMSNENYIYSSRGLLIKID